MRVYFSFVVVSITYGRFRRKAMLFERMGMLSVQDTAVARILAPLIGPLRDP